jgi:TolB-like protein/DNA-binding winged helix-turn-helix (wHTH) protein/Flp pilus assembly protein TadD
MSAGVPRKYLLADFELEPDKCLLLKHNGERVHLPELPFQVLLYLIENRERYVSRQELLDRFWAGSDGYEETLTKCISTIRTQLDDRSVAPRFIETRKKVGYRFIGPVEERLSQPDATSFEIERVRGVKIIVEDDEEILGLAEGVRAAQLTAPGIGENLETQPALVLLPRRRISKYARIGLPVMLIAIAIGSIWVYRHRVGANPPALEAVHSVAVLPLRNLTGDPSNDYFSDGLTESLITSLSKIEDLKVISRSYIFHFKNKDMTPQELGKQIGVAAVLEGSVRKVGNSVRVDVRLVSVDDGRVLWVIDEHDRALGDVFALQDEIARNVAAGLRLQLSGRSEKELARRYTANVEAYQLYLRGRFYFNDYTRKEDLDRAIQLFDAAIATDPNYALAYSGLADTYLTLAVDNWQSPGDVLPKARENAMKALSLDESLGEAHYSRGAVAFFSEWDWELAQKELDRALELNARSLESNACYLHSLTSRGKPDDALAAVRRALRQNPLSTFITNELSCASYYAHNYDQAIDFSEETLRLDQEYPAGHYYTARALEQQQRYEQAIAELNKAISAWGRNTMILSELGYAYGSSGRKSEARNILTELKTRAAKGEFIDPYPLAFIQIALDDKDEALNSLEQAYEARSTWIPWLMVEPKFDKLHNEARFQHLIAKLHLAS